MFCTVAATLASYGLPFAPGPVLADPARDVALSVLAPPGADCSTAERLRELVEARVGSIVFLDADNVRRLVDVQIQASEKGPGFSATLVVRDVGGRVLGERAVTTASMTCDGLEPMLVLVISTLIGLADTRPLAEPRGQRAPDDEQNSQDTRAPKPPATSPRSPSTDVTPAALAPAVPLRFALGLGVQAAGGLLPGAALLVALDVLARHEAFELRVGVTAAPGVESELGAGARANFVAFLGQAQACGIATEHLGGPLSFCAGVRAGGLRAQTSGLSKNVQTFRAVVLLVAGTTMQLSILPQHALLFGAGAAIPLLAPSYYYWERPSVPRDIHTVELGVFAEFGWLWRFMS